MGMGKKVAGDSGSGGAGDISYTVKHADCIDSLGSSGRGDHASGKTINLKQFSHLIQRAAILIYRLMQIKRYLQLSLGVGVYSCMKLNSICYFIT
ncbi:glutamate carboxypeptidase [Flavobacterium omnivorum]|uniref:Glutamate carboxypeptidase n=2 Tax=Flavobacterium omnivorum TaxID=178355 RepID=A0A1G8GS18_9FLAO|nr:glutamate carboxypeptidase [Flavobacterium omnivorum]